MAKKKNYKQKPKAKGSKTTPSAKRKQVSESLQLKAWDNGFWKRNWIPALILFLVPFLVFFQTTGFGFVLDDQIVITKNKFVQKGNAGIGDILTKDTFFGFLDQQQDLVQGARYRPLSLVTFAMEVNAFGKKGEPENQDLATVMHFNNILFYALCALMLFRVLGLFVEGKDQKWFFSMPFIGTLLFILHPTHIEAVANIKGRDEILALLLSLATLYFFWKYVRTRSMLNLALGSGILFLAILAKENSLTFLGVIPLTLFLFESDFKIKDTKALTPMAIALGGVFIFYIGLRYNIIGYLLDSGKEITSIMNNPFYDMTTSQKFASIFYTLGLYLKLLFFPHPLTHDYYPYQIPILEWSDPRAFLSLIIYLVLGGLAVWKLKKWPVISWSILYFIMTLSITSNIPFTVGTFMNERFLFMPSVAACFLLGYWLTIQIPEWLQSKQEMAAKVLPWVILAGFAAFFLYKDFTRTPVWESNETLNLAAIEVSTNSCRANSFYAYTLYRRSLKDEYKSEEKALLEEALPYVNKSLSIYPEYSEAVTCKSGIVAGLYKYDKDIDKLLSEFLDLMDRKHVVFFDQYMAYLNKRGQHKEKLLVFYHHAGYKLFYQKKNNLALAIKYLEFGYQLNPNDLQILADMVEVYGRAGKQKQANEAKSRGASLAPGDPRFQ